MDKYLSPGTVLNSTDSGYYEIKKVTGEGSTSVAYEAEIRSDEGSLLDRVILKEYNPYFITERSDDGSLVCPENREDEFRAGRRRFLDAVRIQREMRLNDETANSTPITENTFEAMGSLFVSVHRYNGETLESYCDSMSFSKAAEVFRAAASVVQAYHSLNPPRLCLDIKPDNIMVIPETSQMAFFIDFDSICTEADILQRGSVPHTPEWAAPEQLMYSGDENSVSVKTDYYLLGEILYWLVFDRNHSSEDEHCSFSEFPFDSAVKYKDELRSPEIRKIISDIFRKTLRSHPSGRYSDISELIKMADELIREIQRQEWRKLTVRSERINNSVIREKSDFVGREDLIREIGEKLERNTVLYITGIAGIGKSELVRQYIARNREDYRNIMFWSYSGDFEYMISRDTDVSVSGFTKSDDETDRKFSRRKLRKIRDLLDPDEKNLIVIDNLDIPYREYSENECWQQLAAMPAEIIITSRVSESRFSSVSVTAISDMSELKKLFSFRCPYEKSDGQYVEKLIQSVKCHTLLVELVAGHITRSGITPEYMLENLLERIPEIHTAGFITEENVNRIISEIYTMDHMTRAQKMILARAAFIPLEGYSYGHFCIVHNIHDRTDFTELIRSGWITVSNGMITVLPVIGTVIVEHIIREGLLESVFSRFIKITDYRRHSSIVVPEIHYVRILESAIHMSRDTYRIRTEEVATLIMMFSKKFACFGRSVMNIDNLDYAIDVLCGLKKLSPFRKMYYGLLEQCWYQKAYHLFLLKKYDEVMAIIRKRLVYSELFRDYYQSLNWYSMLAVIKTIELNSRNISRFRRKAGLLPVSLRCIRQHVLFEDRVKNIVAYSAGHNYGSIYCSRDELSKEIDANLFRIERASYYEDFFWKTKWSGAGILNSILVRSESISLWSPNFRVNRYIFPTVDDNNFYNYMTAQKMYLDRQYDIAAAVLESSVNAYGEKKLYHDYNLAGMHFFLAKIYQMNGRQKEAAGEIKKCLEIKEELSGSTGGNDNFVQRIELVHLYNDLGETDIAYDLNEMIRRDIEEQKPGRGHIYSAHCAVNLAENYYIRGDFSRALSVLNSAKSISSRSAYYRYCLARREYTYGCIMNAQGRTDEAASHFRTALKHYRETTGEHYFEARDCAAALK